MADETPEKNKAMTTAFRNKNRFSADDCCIWQYYEYMEDLDRSKCKICATELKGKVPAQVIKHLTIHPAQYVAFTKDEFKRAPTTINKRRLNKLSDSTNGKGSPVKRSADGSLVTIEIVTPSTSEAGDDRFLVEGKGKRRKFPSMKTKDELDDVVSDEDMDDGSLISSDFPTFELPTLNLAERRRKFKQILVEMVTTTSVPPYIADNEVFRKLVTFLDPQIQILSRETLVREVQRTYKSVKEEMRQLISSAHKLAIGLDVCEKKTVTCGMMGVTAYLYDFQSKRRLVFTLGLKDLKTNSGPNEIKTVLECVLKDYGVLKKQILRFIVGNGGKLNATDAEILPDDEEGNEASIYLNVHFCDQNPESCGTECYANAFRVISNGIKAKKMTCFVTALDSVWKPIEKKSVFDPSIVIATKLIQSLKKVGANVNYLLDDDGKSIKTTRRWIPLFSKIQHLVKSMDTINSICEEEKIEKIHQDHWDRLKKYTDLLAPFKLIRDQHDTKTECTISRVIPAYIFLDQHLRTQLTIQDADVINTANLLAHELKSKVSYVIDLTQPNYDEIYLAATFLDPSVHRILSPEQVNTGYSYLRNLSTEFFNLGVDGEEIIEKDETDEIQEPDDDVDAFEKFLNSTTTKMQPSSRMDKEFLDFTEFVMRKTIGSKTDPLDFWADNDFASSCPILRKLAFDILPTPSTANDIEQIFVAAGHASEGRRNRISTDNLESQVMLKTNAPFLTCFTD